MSEHKRMAIVDGSGNAQLADVVESSTNPGTYGLVILNADGSDLGGGGGGTPGGSNGQIQYNNSGTFGGSTTEIDAAGSITKLQSATFGTGNDRDQLKFAHPDGSGGGIFSYSGVDGYNATEFQRNNYYDPTAATWKYFDNAKQASTWLLDENGNAELWEAAAGAQPIANWSMVYRMTKAGVQWLNQQASTPGDPDAGFAALYFKNDGKLYKKIGSTESEIGGVASTITVANEAADTTCFPAFFTSATGDLGPKTNASFTFNSSTVSLTTKSYTATGTGTPAALSNVKINSYDTVAGFMQNNIQNLSNNAAASSDWIATADTGTDSANYIDMGINSSAYSVGTWTINGALDGYLYTQSSNLAIGTAAAGKNIVLFTGGTLAANARLTLSDTGMTQAAATGTMFAQTMSNNYAANGIGHSITIGNTQTNNPLALLISYGTSANITRGIHIGRGDRPADIDTDDYGLGVNTHSGNTQSAKNTSGILVGSLFNTNSAFNTKGINIQNENNTGAGYNTGISITNDSRKYFQNSGGSGIYINQTGAAGTGLFIYGNTNVNTNTNGLSNITLGNSQSGASTAQKIDLGTSAQGHTGLLINSTGASTSQKSISITMGAGTGTSLNIDSGSGNNKGIVITNGGTGTIAFAMDLTQNGFGATAKTSDYGTTQVSRTCTQTTGTVADNYNVAYFKRTSVQNGAGGTFTQAGSVLKLENVATQTAGTLTDTVDVLRITQAAISTGYALNITAGKSKFSGSLELPYRAVTTTATLGTADYTLDCTTGTFTVNLPAAAGITGRVYVVKNTGTGVITIDGNESETIDGATTITLSQQYQSVELMSNGTNWIIIG